MRNVMQGLQRGNQFRRMALLAIAYLVIAVAIIGANPFRGEVTGPFDLLASHTGWNPTGEPIKVRNRERSDVVDGLIPSWMEARQQVRNGILPLWNPLPAGGSALILDPTKSILTPAFALFAMSPDPAYGFYFSVLFSLLASGLGMHLFAARHVSNLAALFAGVSYMMCGFITAWLFWAHTYTAIWIPWLLLAVDDFLHRNLPRNIAAIAAITAVMVLGGFPFVAAIGLGSSLVYAFVVSLWERKRFPMTPRLLGTIAGIGLGLAIIAVPLLSMWSLLDGSDLSYRRPGSIMRLATHAKLLFRPWAGDSPQVETNMYVGMFALLFATVAIVRMALGQRIDAFIATGVVLTGVGVTLAFGVLPVEIGKHMPVLSNNPWSRAILLLDIGLILMAAAGLDWLVHAAKGRRAIMTFAIAIFAVHAVDLHRQFRLFNGATPAKYFYSTSPAMDYLRDRIGKFQYISQDASAFMISGTAGAVGLGDWYGHSMRSEGLRKMLATMADEPFSSPTSTSLRIDRFHWAAPLMDIVGNCYAIYPSEKGESVISSATGKSRYAMPPFNGLNVAQTFNLSIASRVSGIALRLATYRASGLDGTVNITLKAADTDVEIARASLPARLVADNQFATFTFAKAVDIPAGSYELGLTYLPGPKNLRLTAWVLEGPVTDLRRDGEGLAGSLDYLILGQIDKNPNGGALRLLKDDGRIAVAENAGCMHGPYWTADLRDPLATAQLSGVSLSSYEPHHFVIDVSAHSEGHVVVPMRFVRGWVATAGGREMPIQLVAEVIPAVKVLPGTSRLVFRYAPPYWKQGLTISIAALIAFSIFSLRRRRRASQA